MNKSDHSVECRVKFNKNGPKIWNSDFREDWKIDPRQTMSRIPNVGEYISARGVQCDTMCWIICKVVAVKHEASNPNYQVVSATLLLEETDDSIWFQ